MNIRITDYKEVEADLSEKSLDELKDLFGDFLLDISEAISEKKWKKFLKFSGKYIKQCQDLSA